MKLVRSFAGAALATSVLAIAPSAYAQTTTLRIESTLPAGHATSKSMQIFKQEVVRLSAGAMDVEVTTNSPRTFKELVDGVHVGRVFATWTSIGNFAKLVPEIAAVSLPFVFDDYGEARRAIAGPVGTLISTKLEAKGFVVLGWMDLGALQVSNSKRPLKTIDDFNGLRIRVLPIATHAATFQALGARPIIMDLTDVAAALRQGDVDGQELDYSTLLANKYYENQKYLSETNHFLDFHVLVVDKSVFARLHPAEQKTVREAAAIAAVRQRDMLNEDEAAALGRLQEIGMQYDPLPRETRAALRRATARVVDDVRKSVGADIVNKVLAAKTAPAADKATPSDKAAAGKNRNQSGPRSF
jgi:tripartite ATP-independent transporter DctP family solute receptor